MYLFIICLICVSDYKDVYVDDNFDSFVCVCIFVIWLWLGYFW